MYLLHSYAWLCDSFVLRLTGVYIYELLRAVDDPPDHLIGHFAIIFVTLNCIPHTW